MKLKTEEGGFERGGDNSQKSLMRGEVLTTDAPKCVESVNIMYSYGMRACLHKENMIRAVQKRIWPTYKGKPQRHIRPHS